METNRVVYRIDKMNIAFVGPGIMSIPPIGWGAVETLIWDCANELDDLGHTGSIINTPNRQEIISFLQEDEYDFIHLHYDVFYDVMDDIHNACPNAKLAISSHYPYIDQEEKHRSDGYDKIFNWLTLKNKYYNFPVSKKDYDFFKSKSLTQKNIIQFKTGASSKFFTYLEEPIMDKSIYLAKIDIRKKQYLYQSINSIDFVGPLGNVNKFDTNKNYLGEWTKEKIYNDLTNYSNMVILSDGENGTPLVIKEALMAGLGVVTSEYCAYELDRVRPFITIIPNDKLTDIEYVKQKIIDNKKISVKMRADIRKYAIDNFSWNSIMKDYIENIQKLK